MCIPCAIGYGQILIIALVVLLLFGGAKIPELMRGVGRGVKEFKDAMNTDYSAEERQKKEAERASHESAADRKSPDGGASPEKGSDDRKAD